MEKLEFKRTKTDWIKKYDSIVFIDEDFEKNCTFIEPITRQFINFKIKIKRGCKIEYIQSDN